MSTTPASLYPNYYQPQYTGSTVGYQTGNSPVQAAQNQRAVVQSTGNQLIGTDEELANEYAAQQGGTQAYLNPLEMANASGQGGYSPSEASQIELTPQQQQDIVTSAGISAGTGNASAVGAAERAAAATGGNPAALATYRARAAQSQAADAGQAETGAKVAAQQAGSAGAQAVGNAQLAQENQGLGYLGNLQSQQGSEAQTEQGLTQQAYGTQTQGTNEAAKTGISAAGVPTTTDKLIGAAAGAASAFLADGEPGYLDDGGQDAVVGEDGMEAVIENAPKAVVNAASDPVRSNTEFMANGYHPEATNENNGSELWNSMTANLNANVPLIAPAVPVSQSASGAPQQVAAQKSSSTPSWLQKALANPVNQTSTQQSPEPGQPGWNKTTPYSQLGSAIGSIGRKLMQPDPPPARSVGSTAGSSQMPTGSLANQPYTMPGGLVNRTGSPVDGTPSVPVSSPADYLDRSGVGGDMAASPAPMMATGKMGGGFHWSNPAPRPPETPHMLERSGYQPLGYRGKPMLADGSVAEPQGGGVDPAAIDNPERAAEPGNGMQVGGAKVFSKPTMVHLEKTDMVVPLSFRPKAKVRPSAAMPALTQRRRMYGSHAA